MTREQRKRLRVIARAARLAAHPCRRFGHDGYIDDLIAGTMRCARCGMDLTGTDA